MMRPTERRRSLLCGAALCVVMACGGATRVAAGDNAYGISALQSDLGGVGLLQTPTARMADTGEVSVGYSRIKPYSYVAVSVQPLDWLEFGFRYTSISNREYGEKISDRDLLDKGVDLKLRLTEEGRYMPQVAVGMRDLGGTGLFSSEYIVANKRWNNFDFSLGAATGYLGAGGHINNPLGWGWDHFKERGGRSGDHGGTFNSRQWFTGDIGLFGGVAWHTPWQPLTLMVEYDGNDYQHEPLDNNQNTRSRLNVGARYRLNDHVVLSAGWERGNTAMLGLSLNLNFARSAASSNDPPPVPTHDAPVAMTDQWQQVARKLETNAGIRVAHITRRDNTLIVEGSPTRYRALAEAELRANRILHNNVPAAITHFKYRWLQSGLLLREDVLPRAPLPDTPFISDSKSAFVDQDYRHGVTARDVPIRKRRYKTDKSLHTNRSMQYDFSLRPKLTQSYGGPDGYLYALSLRLDGTIHTDPNGFLSGSLGYDLIGNFDQYDYRAESKLPRVRTRIADYLKHDGIGIYNLQYTRTARLADDWYGMGYFGLLERMYGGVGAEVLYRPFNSSLAIGADVNWVRQRDFTERFSFRDYDTVTGHVTGYWDTGFKDIRARLSIGRYLARDWGTTLDLSRRFDSGVRIGAWATFTDAGSDYGEGSFDKGLYISIPLDFLLDKSTLERATIPWIPLTRDGGARLGRRYQLYDMTDKRRLQHYWSDFEYNPHPERARP